MKKGAKGSMVWTAVALAAVAGVPANAVAQSHSHSENGSMKNIVETAVEAGTFSTLVAAVQAAGLVETLQGEGPFTVFAPSDAAFAKLPAGTVEALLQNKADLTAVLTFHVVSGRVTAGDVIAANGATPATVNGERLAIEVRDGKVYVGGAQVVTADIHASNGVIHVIDTVLLPSPATAGR